MYLQDHTSRIVINLSEQRNGVYHFRTMTFVQACKTSGVDSFIVWHRRLGHPSSQMVSLLPSIHVGKKDKHEQVCDIYLRAKQTRDIFIPSQNKVNEHYFSHVVWIYLLAEKSEVVSTFKKLCTMVATRFNKKVKIERNDNGTKFRVLRGYFNSCVERKNSHILNVSQALYLQANIPIEFWGACVLTTTYLINRTPSIIHKGKTPNEILSFGVYVMCTFHLNKKTSLVIKVENVFLWTIIMGKRGGISMIWML
ncbi:hypothetical protein CR513_23196, partial [Mucuna pruriens]